MTGVFCCVLQNRKTYTWKIVLPFSRVCWAPNGCQVFREGKAHPTHWMRLCRGTRLRTPNWRRSQWWPKAKPNSRHILKPQIEPSLKITQIITTINQQNPPQPLVDLLEPKVKALYFLNHWTGNKTATKIFLELSGQWCELTWNKCLVYRNSAYFAQTIPSSKKPKELWLFCNTKCHYLTENKTWID